MYPGLAVFIIKLIAIIRGGLDLAVFRLIQWGFYPIAAGPIRIYSDYNTRDFFNRNARIDSGFPKGAINKRRGGLS